MVRWTRFVLRHRRWVVGFWIAVLASGGFASSKISPLLSNSFNVPGTDSERARIILERNFGNRPDGTFTVIFQVANAGDQVLVARLQTLTNRAAHTVPTGTPTTLVTSGRHLVYGYIESRLDLAQAKRATAPLVSAVGSPAGVEHAYVSGAGPIQHDLDPIFSADLKRGEGIAIPIALLVLFAVFGLSVAVTMPFIFAACTITGATGIMYRVANVASTPTYVTNLIQANQVTVFQRPSGPDQVDSGR